MVEHTICSTCQADISGVAGQHLDETMHAGYYSGWRKEQTGTKTYTVNHPEQGHYESIVTGYNVAVEQFNEMEVYNHITDWFRIEKRLRRGIWFRLCDGSDFFKNDYRTTRYGPHDLHSFGRGYRLISEKMISTYEIKLSTGAHFSLAWLVVLAQMVSNWCQNRKNHNFKRNKILQTIDFKGFAKK